MMVLTFIGYLIFAISVSPSSSEYILHLGKNVSTDALEVIPKMLEHIGCLPTAQVSDIKVTFYSDDESTTKMNLNFKNITTNRQLRLFIEKHKGGVTNLNFIDSNIKYYNFFNRKSSFHTHNLLIDTDKLIPAGHPLLDCSALTSGDFLSKSQQVNHLVGPTNKAFAYSEAFIKYKTPKGCISYCLAYNANNATAHVIGLRMNDSCSPKESPIFFC